MANFAYTFGKLQIMNGAIDLSSDDIRIMLVMTNSTADTDQDVDFIDQIGTLDEMDDVSYVRKALASEATAVDDPNNRAEFTADPVTWTALGAGTREVLGAVIFKFVTNDADSILLAYIDTGGFPFAATGADVTITPPAEGWIQIT